MTDGSLEENVIECDHITHHYGDRLIYKDLTFNIKKGQVVGLLGKNGTGKTTIINILNGFLRPTNGHCRIFGEDSSDLSPATKARIGLQIEGHIQHSYFTVRQIEQFYSRFFKEWDADAYYSLLSKLKVTPRQRISTMSCGQRSQVALGLLMAQRPDLLILDDFSMGLDPGYRRLFIERLQEYVSDGDRTVFLTSHIIQDMENFISDCIIFDYGRVLVQMPTNDLLSSFRKYTFTTSEREVGHEDGLWNPELVGGRWEVYSFLPEAEVVEKLERYKPEGLQASSLTLHDAFIGLTGKY